MAKDDKKRKRERSVPREMKRKQIEALALAGKTVKEISEEVGIARQNVSKYLNSEETKAKVKEIDGRLAAMIDDALVALHESILNRSEPATRLTAAMKLLKNFGTLRESVDMSVTFPKPTIIERPNGTTVILGTEMDKEEG